MRTAWLIGVVLVLCAQVRAHHAFASTYVLDKTVTIEGRVVEFLFRDPHSFVIVQTAEGTWTADWGGAEQLSRHGIDKDTLKPGDRVVVIGNPSRNSADRRVRIESITRPSDGWKWNHGPH